MLILASPAESTDIGSVGPSGATSPPETARVSSSWTSPVLLPLAVSVLSRRRFCCKRGEAIEGVFPREPPKHEMLCKGRLGVMQVTVVAVDNAGELEDPGVWAAWTPAVPEPMHFNRCC